MRNTNKFWPLDYDPEVEIYENLAWDLPGFRRARQTASPSPGTPKRQQKLK